MRKRAEIAGIEVVYVDESIDILLVYLSSVSFLPDIATEETPREKQKIPFFILFCGLMSLGAFIPEGASAEWGALLLKDVKGADAGTAALCFGALSAPMAVAK